MSSKMSAELSLHTSTEALNPATTNLDQLSTADLLRVMNQQDQLVALAVQEALPQLEPLLEAAAEGLALGGRLLYVGAGTSGRLGVLDAAECPPTFRTEAWQVQGLIAGGAKALLEAVEGAEDDAQAGQEAMLQVQVQANDTVVGLSASGGAPYVLGAMQQAKTLGAQTGAVCCVPGSALAQAVQWPVVVETGPEVLAGSTRLKAGTAQKLVLNMLSTGVMVRLGKTYGNRMVDVKASNQKLKKRCLGLVQDLATVELAVAQALLEQCEWEVKTAIVMAQKGCSAAEARERLQQVNGHLRQVL
jgi:N-acetylmuramic acid 6-phosphate etherase